MLDFIYRELFGSHWYMPFYSPRCSLSLQSPSKPASAATNGDARAESWMGDVKTRLAWALGICLTLTLLSLVPCVEVPAVPLRYSVPIGAVAGVLITAFTVYLSNRWRPE